jgi:phage-related protein
MAAALTEIAERGFEARGMTFRQIEAKLWEVRVGPHRVFCVVLRPEQMVLLHPYRKQTQKAPARQLVIARLEKPLEPTWRQPSLSVLSRYAAALGLVLEVPLRPPA